MFSRLWVDNYKCLVNFELRLREMSLLLGPNGSGKTSVLDVVLALRQLLTGTVRVTDPGVFPTRTLTRWDSRDLQVAEVEVALEGLADLEDEVLRYRVEVEHERATKRARIRLEELVAASGDTLFRCELGSVQLYRDDGSSGPQYHVDWTESALARVAPRPDNRRLTAFLEFFGRVVVCGLIPPAYRTESVRESEQLSRNGHNFADWYRHAIQEHPDRVQAFVAALQDAIGGFRGIRLEKVGHEARSVMIMQENDGTRYDMRLDEASDGERALATLYALLHLGQGSTILLDEPDNYVGLPEIQPWLTALSDACGDTVPQAVLCSHHPEAIDYLGSHSGIFLRRESSGVATAHYGPRTEAAKPGLKLSELIARGWEE